MADDMSLRPCLQLRVHGRLLGFLAPARRGGAFRVPIDGVHAVKDPIESVGIPHPEIARVEVDGVPRPLAYRVRGGESVDVHPVVRQSAGTPPRFVLDVHLGRLARHLRLAGLDTVYDTHTTDERLRALALAEDRVLLTRDVALLKRRDIGRAAFVHATDPALQMAELCDRFDLAPWFAPFTRCAACNGALEPIDPAGVAPEVPPRVLEAAPRFSRCAGCGRVYWPGSHEGRFRARLARVGVHLP